MESAWIEEVFRQAPFLRQHLICLAYAGSRSYGTDTAESDTDLRGIAFAPIESMFGLDTYEQTMLVEPDTAVYSLEKFAKLALKGNPNILELLYVEPDNLVFIRQEGEELRRNRHLFLSKRLFHSFGGYAIRNLRQLSKASSDSADTNKPYHTKDASHLIRLLQMGSELLRTGEMRVKRPNYQELLSIKRGEWPLADLLRYAEECYETMCCAYDETQLPEEADRLAVTELLIRLQREFYCR